MRSLVGMSVAHWPRSDGASVELVGAEGCGERSRSESAPERAEMIFIYGDAVFHATVVTVNEAGLSCFLLESGRLENS